MALHYEVHGRNGWYPVDLYDNPEDGQDRAPRHVKVATFVKTRKLADEICKALNEALTRGHVEATERLGL